MAQYRTVRHRRPRSQPRIKGVARLPRHTAVLPEIETILETEARRYNVSVSFVVATAIAFAFSVDEQPDYRKENQKENEHRSRIVHFRTDDHTLCGVALSGVYTSLAVRTWKYVTCLKCLARKGAK